MTGYLLNDLRHLLNDWVFTKCLEAFTKYPGYLLNDLGYLLNDLRHLLNDWVFTK